MISFMSRDSSRSTSTGLRPEYEYDFNARTSTITWFAELRFVGGNGLVRCPGVNREQRSDERTHVHRLVRRVPNFPAADWEAAAGAILLHLNRRWILVWGHSVQKENHEEREEHEGSRHAFTASVSAWLIAGTVRGGKRATDRTRMKHGCHAAFICVNLCFIRG